MAIAEILASIAEFIGEAFLLAKYSKRDVPFPTISQFSASLVFFLVGLLATFILHGLVPAFHPLATVLSVSVGTVALIVGVYSAGVRLGFVFTPIRCVVYALFSAVGSLGALFLANAL